MSSGFSKLDLLLMRVVWVTPGKEQAAPQLGKGKRKTMGLISRGMRSRRLYIGGQELAGRN